MVEIVKFIFAEPYRLFFLAIIVWLMFPIIRTKCNCDHEEKKDATK